jgi:hypothetical protein
MFVCVCVCTRVCLRSPSKDFHYFRHVKRKRNEPTICGNKQLTHNETLPKMALK